MLSPLPRLLVSNRILCAGWQVPSVVLSSSWLERLPLPNCDIATSPRSRLTSLKIRERGQHRVLRSPMSPQRYQHRISSDTEFRTCGNDIAIEEANSAVTRRPMRYFVYILEAVRLASQQHVLTFLCSAQVVLAERTITERLSKATAWETATNSFRPCGASLR